MGNTYRKNSPYKPKKHGRVFDKDDKSWKKSKHKNKLLDNDVNLLPTENYSLPDINI